MGAATTTDAPLVFGPRRFHLDTEDPSIVPHLDAIGEGPRWNGWRTPIVTEDAMRRFIGQWRANDPNGEWGDVFVTTVTAWTDTLCPDGTPDDTPVLVVSRRDMDAEDWDAWPGEYMDGPVPVFHIDGWVWVA